MKPTRARLVPLLFFTSQQVFMTSSAFLQTSQTSPSSFKIYIFYLQLQQWLLTMTFFDGRAGDLCGYVVLFAEISVFHESLWTLTVIAFTKKAPKSIYLAKDGSILQFFLWGQVARAASSVSGLLLHIIIPKRSNSHSSPWNYTRD